MLKKFVYSFAIVIKLSTIQSSALIVCIEVQISFDVVFTASKVKRKFLLANVRIHVCWTTKKLILSKRMVFLGLNKVKKKD